MNGNVDRGMEVLLRNMQRIHANIQFADRKAGLLMAADSALLALIQPLISSQTQPISCLVASFVAAGILILAVIFAFCVIWPRGDQNRRRGPGVVCPDRIALHEDAASFVKAIASMTSEDIYPELQMLTYDYAYIDRAKYWWLRLFVVPASAIGGILAVIVLLWSRF